MVKRKTMRRGIIVQVRQSKRSRQKTVTIPKSSRGVRAGDYVLIKRLR